MNPEKFVSSPEENRATQGLTDEEADRLSASAEGAIENNQPLAKKENGPAGPAASPVRATPEQVRAWLDSPEADRIRGLADQAIDRTDMIRKRLRDPYLSPEEREVTAAELHKADLIEQAHFGALVAMSENLGNRAKARKQIEAARRELTEKAGEHEVKLENARSLDSPDSADWVFVYETELNKMKDDLAADNASLEILDSGSKE